MRILASRRVDVTEKCRRPQPACRDDPSVSAKVTAAPAC